MSISRRSFLKLFAAVPAVAAVGLPEISYAEELMAHTQAQPIAEQSGKVAVGYMREMIGWDLRHKFVVRHNVTDGKEQWGIDQLLSDKYTEEMLTDARNVAVSALRKKLKENGISEVAAPPNHWGNSKHVRFA